ncbi:MAG TPA: flavodoxin family protein [Spirochaetota bacterium]|nr:flavodoxin family protein [Spirochaetota bacterium]HOR44552.1 flavodoxin family protein [Spirochaetota bacterium]HPK56407.1 flavodoxin family protein [Spirochaetota bacterium]
MDALKIKLLSVYSSPRENSLSGYTHKLLVNKYFPNIKADEIFLSKSPISPCSACSFCSKTDQCSIDDIMKEYYKLIMEADVITVSFPLYFSTVPAQLKLFIDRAQLFWEMKKRNEFVKKKTGIIIAAAGNNYNDMFHCAEKTMRHFFKTVNAEYNKEYSVFISSTDDYSSEENKLRADKLIKKTSLD